MDSRTMMSHPRLHGGTPRARAVALPFDAELVPARLLLLLGLAVLLAFMATAPAHAQYYNTGYNNGYYNTGYNGYNQGSYPSSYYGYNQGYYQPSGNLWGKIKNFFSSPSYGGPSSGLGRTTGGAAGMAAGAFGGAALASAVIKAGGSAMMANPIAPILVGTAITTGAAFLGSKLGSHAGVWGDTKLGPDMTWTLVGAAGGAMAGFALLPALGPFAGPAGRVLGGAIGGIAGGVLGKIFAPQINRLATPKMIYGAAGAAVGGLGFGIPGAIAGAVGGYVLGGIFDKSFFAEPGSSTQGDIRRNAFDYSGEYWNARRNVNAVGNWVSNTSRQTGNYLTGRLQSNYDYNPYYSGYYTGYTPSYGGYTYGNYAYGPESTGDDGSSPTAGTPAAETAADVSGMSAAELRARRNEIILQANGVPGAAQWEEIQRIDAHLRSLESQ